MLLSALDRLNLTIPTPVQAMAIPVAMEGGDILASAQTGTGKTFAYVLPLMVKIMKNPECNALILAPTRELAVQIKDAIKSLMGKMNSFNMALLIGGDAMFKQFSELKSHPRIIVGTPGRINDHLARGTLMLKKTSFLVIDEGDRMLDMGFGVQLDKIAKHLPQNRQTLLFSATLPPNILKLSERYLQNPTRVSINPSAKPALHIQQDLIHTKTSEKFGHLMKELGERNGSIIIFVKTKRGAKNLAEKLNLQNESAEAIHGDLRQNKRHQVLKAFHNKKHRILVATDVAARGLDIPHIRHVINFDLPQCPEDYIHRIGRTGRAGADGSSLCLVSPEDTKMWRSISRLMNPNEAEAVVHPASLRKNKPGRIHNASSAHKSSNTPKRTFPPQRPRHAKSSIKLSRHSGGIKKKQDR